MSPAPSVKHQRVAGHFHGILYSFLKKKSCNLFSAPFDVRLLDKNKSSKANQDVFTVVQPDLCVICDQNKLDEKGCIGAPDLVIEILSPGNSKKEIKYKYELYEEAGVREYWLVFPSVYLVQQFLLNENGKYFLNCSYVEDEKFSPFIFPEMIIDLAEVFEIEE